MMQISSSVNCAHETEILKQRSGHSDIKIKNKIVRQYVC